MTDMNAVNNTVSERINVELHVVSRPMINKAARARLCGATTLPKSAIKRLALMRERTRSIMLLSNRFWPFSP